MHGRATIGMLLFVTCFVSGCSVHWGTGELGEPPPLDTSHAHLGDAEVRRLLTVRRALDARLLAVARRIAQRPLADGSAALYDERLALVVALARVDAAIERRRTAIERGEQDLPHQRLAGDAEALVAEAEAAIDETRARHAARGKDLWVPEAPEPEPVADALGGLPAGGDGKSADATVTGKVSKQKRKRRRGPRKRKFGDDAPDLPPGFLDGRADAKPAPQAAAVADSGPPPDVFPAVEDKLDAIGACLPRVLRDGGVFLMVKVRVAKDGNFRNVKLRTQPPLSPSVTGCVVDILSAIRVEPTGASRIVKIPLSMSGS